MPTTPSSPPPAEPRRLADLAKKRWLQVALATALALAHLVAFTVAAHSRLNASFDYAPDTHLQFADPHAKELFYPRQPAKWSRLVVSRMDAQHYISQALRGLSACPTDPTHATGDEYLECGLGWLPAYSMVGRAVMKVTGLEPDYALMLVSVACAIIINLLWLCPTMVRRLGLFEAYAVLLAWNCYTGAFSLVAPLSESLTIVLVVAGFIALANERWLLSGLLIGASTAIRLPTVAPAFALGCCLLLAAWQRRKAGTAQWWRPLVAVPLCGWGQFLTLFAFQLTLHNWHAYFDARWAYGDTNHLGRWLDITYFLRGFNSQSADTVMYVALLAITVLVGREALAGFSRIEKAFLVISSAMTFFLVIVSPSFWWGITRYMMLCLLPFLSMGALARRHRAVYVVWLVVGLLFYWHLEMCGYVSAGDPSMCPCQGRTEFKMPWQS